jgi:DNA polymerase III delta prime subunit
MKLENIPFWIKYRPDTLDKSNGKIVMILLPRIKRLFENELSMNYIFYSGCGGTGKSTLANILTKDTDCLKINSSIDKGIDVVREQLFNHCTKYSLFGGSKIKTVWMDEFDGTTSQMRDALRGFIEEHPHVRFIATVNSLSKINRTDQDKALLSRFNLINFEPTNEEEKDFLFKNQSNFLKSLAKKEVIDIDDEIIEKIIKTNFPNFRLSVQHIQELSLIGDYELFKETIDLKNSELFEFLLNGNNDAFENYSLVMEDFKDKTDELLKLLSRPLFIYIMNNKSDIFGKVSMQLIKLSKEYNAEYFDTLDPEIHLISYISDLKEIFKKQ